MADRLRMPRRARTVEGDFAYHVLNRSVRRVALFESFSAYDDFEFVMWATMQTIPVRLLAYCAMPNHWHLIVWPRDQRELSRFMHRLTMAHAQRWHREHKTNGTGPVYQGRYKAIPILTEQQLLVACRYVERNPLRAALVPRAERWRWSSLWLREQRCDRGFPTPWPIPMPPNWLEIVNGDPSPKL